jgi:hypothetical protein
VVRRENYAKSCWVNQINQTTEQDLKAGSLHCEVMHIYTLHNAFKGHFIVKFSKFGGHLTDLRDLLAVGLRYRWRCIEQFRGLICRLLVGSILRREGRGGFNDGHSRQEATLVVPIATERGTNTSLQSEVWSSRYRGVQPSEKRRLKRLP